MTTTGTGLTEFSLPVGSFPQGIAPGPNGSLWFVDQKKSGLYTICTITTAGQITEYPTNINAGPFQLYQGFGQSASGPDGNLWFVNPQAGVFGGSGGNLIGKITTGGVVTTYPLSDLPYGITAGGDGNLWVGESAACREGHDVRNGNGVSGGTGRLFRDYSRTGR